MTGAPRPGEIYWMESADAQGHEQGGRRPVLVVTDARLAGLGLTWVVPLTTTDRGWPLHVRVRVQGRVGVALCEQLRSVSTARLGRLVGGVSHDELMDVRAVLHDIVGH